MDENITFRLGYSTAFAYEGIDWHIKVCLANQRSYRGYSTTCTCILHPFCSVQKRLYLWILHIYICIHLYILIWTHIATFCDTFRICREILKVKILDYLHIPMNPVTKILNAILTTFCPKNGQEHSSEFIKQLLYFAPSTC